MLVLARRKGESILLFPSDDIPTNLTVNELFADDPIEIYLTNVKANEARIGILGA